MSGPLGIQTGESPAEGIRRVAIASASDARERLAKDNPSEKDIHEARKRLKELRALVRLVGGGMPDRGRPLRSAMRDAGRTLASARDSEALVESFDKLRERFAAEWGSRRFAKIRRALVNQKVPSDSAGREAVLAALGAIREELERVPLDAGGFALLSAGLRTGYRRARRGRRTALDARSAEAFHEWRKRVKEHWYHVQVIEEAWPAALGPLADSLRLLSRSLGDHHDLAMLRETWRARPETFGSQRLLRAFDRFAAVRMAELETEAETLGGRLFAEKPRAWLRRMGGYWRLWQRRM